jgi:uncharacterized protein (DUF4415 family)
MTEKELQAAAASDPDNPPANDEWLKNAKLVERQRKEAISLRVDADVLAWFRSRGEGYQTLMNNALRSYATFFGSGNPLPLPPWVSVTRVKLPAKKEDPRRRKRAG